MFERKIASIIEKNKTDNTLLDNSNNLTDLSRYTEGFLTENNDFPINI